MTRRLVVIGIVAAVTALVGTKLVLLAVGGRPGPGFKYLWRRPGPIGRRALWSVVILLPIVGPLLYGSLGPAPSLQPEHLRSPENPDAFVAGERATVRTWRDLTAPDHDADGHQDGDA